jgi:hypothetical protein
VVIKAESVERDDSGKLLLVPNAEFDYKGKFTSKFKRIWNSLYIIQSVSHGVFGRNCCESRN